MFSPVAVRARALPARGAQSRLWELSGMLAQAASQGLRPAAAASRRRPASPSTVLQTLPRSGSPRWATRRPPNHV